MIQDWLEYRTDLVIIYHFSIILLWITNPKEAKKYFSSKIRSYFAVNYSWYPLVYLNQLFFWELALPIRAKDLCISSRLPLILAIT